MNIQLEYLDMILLKIIKIIRELCDYLNMNEIKIENNQLKIKLIEIKHITNMSHMFDFCSSLVSLPDISKWKLNKELYKEDMLLGCNERIIPEKFK